MKETTLPNGLAVFHLDAADTGLLYQEFFIDHLYQRVTFREGDVIFDAGANIGFFVLLMNQLHQQATVYAFEPIPQIFQVLTANAERHNHLDLHLHNQGLAEQRGQARFTYFPRTATSSSRFPDISQDAEGRQASRRYIADDIRRRLGRWSCLVPQFVRLLVAEPIRRFYQRHVLVDCELTTVSEVIRRHDIEKIDLLKVDAEGSEPNILRGVDEEHWPRIRQLIVEVHRGQEELDEISTMLSQHGFDLHVEQQTPHLFEKHFVLFAQRENTGS